MKKTKKKTKKVTGGINLNELAALIARKETGKKEVSIAQIKEIIKLISIEMYAQQALIPKLLRNGKKNFKNELSVRAAEHRLISKMNKK